MPIKERLASRVLASYFGEPAYYGDKTTDMIDEAHEVGKKHPEFLAKLAVFARETMFLRTAPTVLVGILGLHGKPFVRPVMRRVILRPDQITELLAWCNSQNTPNINQIKIGVGEAFNRFDEYQFGKYKGGGGKISLRDALIWCHAKPADELHEKLFEQLIDGTVKTPMTWETEVSTRGNNAATWEALIDSNKLPYMAALRNLRNMLNAGISFNSLKTVCGMLSNPVRVARSKQYPYRFFSAARELSRLDSPYVGDCLEAIGQAADYSVANVPKLEGRTFLSADNSGSMESPVSGKSKMERRNVANLMQAIFKAQNGESITSVFGTEFHVVNVRPGSGVIENCERFKSTQTGWCTNGHLAIQYLIREKVVVDRIVVLTDGQLWDIIDSREFKNSIDLYRQTINPDCWVHIINLAGYGDAVFPRGSPQVSLISGWTDRIFEFMAAVESGAGTLVKQIEAIKL